MDFTALRERARAWPPLLPEGHLKRRPPLDPVHAWTVGETVNAGFFYAITLYESGVMLGWCWGSS